MALAPKLLLLTASLPLLGLASDFNSLVHEFSRQTGVRETHIPFFGLARFVVAVAHPAGTSDLKLAIFENVDGRQWDFMNAAEGIAYTSGWKRIVRVRSRNREFVNIYTMPEGRKLRMLVTTIDHGDAVFVEMRIKPEELIRFVDEHRHDQH